MLRPSRPFNVLHYGPRVVRAHPHPPVPPSPAPVAPVAVRTALCHYSRGLAHTSEWPAGTHAYDGRRSVWTRPLHAQSTPSWLYEPISASFLAARAPGGRRGPPRCPLLLPLHKANPRVRVARGIQAHVECRSVHVAPRNAAELTRLPVSRAILPSLASAGGDWSGGGRATRHVLLIALSGRRPVTSLLQLQVHGIKRGVDILLLGIR